MCWISETKPILRTAIRDIPVLKVLVKPQLNPNNLYPVYRCGKKPYNIGITYYADKLDEPIEEIIDTWLGLKMRSIRLYKIHHGIHSMRKGHVEIRYFKREIAVCETFKDRINDDVNKVTTSIDIYPYRHIYLCHIPKGAKYYLNGSEYVSDRIIVDKEIPVEDYKKEGIRT